MILLPIPIGEKLCRGNYASAVPDGDLKRLRVSVVRNEVVVQDMSDKRHVERIQSPASLLPVSKICPCWQGARRSPQDGHCSLEHPRVPLAVLIVHDRLRAGYAVHAAREYNQ